MKTAKTLFCWKLSLWQRRPKRQQPQQRKNSGQELMLIDLRSPFLVVAHFYDFFTNLQTHTPSQAFYTTALSCCSRRPLQRLHYFLLPETLWIQCWKTVVIICFVCLAVPLLFLITNAYESVKLALLMLPVANVLSWRLIECHEIQFIDRLVN